MTVERESTNHKLLGLVEKIPSFIEEMEHLEVMSHQKVQITPDMLNNVKDISTALALFIGGFIIATYRYDFEILPDGSRLY